MPSIKTGKDWTWRDLAVRLYKNVDAVLELIVLNYQLFADGAEVDITDVLPEGTEIFYNTSPLVTPVEELEETAAPALRNFVTRRNQTWRDVAVQLYGNVDAVLHLVTLNPQLFADGTEVDITGYLDQGTEIFYDTDKTYINKKALKALGGRIIAGGANAGKFDDVFATVFE